MTHGKAVKRQNRMRWFTFAGLLVATACAHEPSPRAAEGDERTRRWGEWASRVEALPRCLPMEWAAAPQPPAAAFVPGETVQVRGHLGLIELSCADAITELLLRGRWLPSADAVMSLAELEDAVARSERETCGSVLGLKTGEVGLALENPFNPLRVWKQNDAELFDALLSQTDAIVFGVIEAVGGRQAMVRADRLCRGPGPPLVLERPADTAQRWRLFDGLEHLAGATAVPRARRAQALRVLFDVAVSRDRSRARRAAERLATGFGDSSRLEWLSKRPPASQRE
jgi:hypothetical protein